MNDCAQGRRDRHGVHWDVWNREDQNAGPWPCLYCGKLVDVRVITGFYIAHIIIREEP